MKKYDYKPFETTEIGHPIIQRTAPKVRVSDGDGKVTNDLAKIVKDNVKDGMTISFHHHFRNGDFIFNTVMEEIMRQGIKNF